MNREIQFYVSVLVRPSSERLNSPNQFNIVELFLTPIGRRQDKHFSRCVFAYLHTKKKQRKKKKLKQICKN